MDIETFDTFSTQKVPVQSLQEVGNAIISLRERVDALSGAAAPLDIAPVTSTEWYQLITQKLLPQLSDSTYLVVAVVGGTNIGKSVIFNHLCGSKVSATSPLASGTKHPTCLTPTRLASDELLTPVFSEFELRHSDDAEDALQGSDDDFLFWRESPEAPENLLLLDTPDIDSDAQVNWSRADKVRRAADVLIAVLTQQKYNDAAVKKFFRAAAEEDKSILVVFNQLLLPEDEEYWPIWLQTFCEETGISPEYVYLAPHDRRAAEQNQLPFYNRDWPQTDESTSNEQPRNLMEDLSQLRFEEIKLKSLAGALDTLCDKTFGVPTYLDEIRRRSGIHGDAWKRLTERMQEISVTWPVVPNRVVIQEVRNWWGEQRTGWEANVHGFYDAIGRGLMWPVRQFQGRSADDEPQWIKTYRQEEWRTIQVQLVGIYDRLESLSEHGHPVLRTRLEQLMAGQSREETLAKLKQLHKESPFEEELQALVKVQMQKFRDDQKDWFKMFKRLDTAAAAARPAVTVALFATGVGPVGNAMMPMVTDTALQAALHVAGDVTAGTVTAAVGDTAISSGTSTGVRYLEAWFHQFHQNFVQIRKLWLLKQLQEHLWGTLLDDLQTASDLPRSEEFRAVEQELTTLRKLDLRT
ncbi:GTPase [Rubinisphaera margarita]|uniref:GTPase n=1 Tax=Rubinisphaera margarita TaxID=2909586 RepID=UPI001EE8AB00|nr:GTPase [Rubinisphaera margarita]MCG6157420.1 50S ribosome-binding GTPase [Rubinisphaera margarita]